MSIEREILRAFWKIHILHHASEGPILGHWMLQELRQHGYRVSPGTLYPLLKRLHAEGWLKPVPLPAPKPPGAAQAYALTPRGLRALARLQRQLAQLRAETLP